MKKFKTRISINKKEATERGTRLLKRMKGKGWKLRVYENMGWWYTVYNGPITVCEHTPGRFSTLMLEKVPSDTFCGGVGSHLWYSETRTFKDPNRAVKYQVKLARKRANVILDAVEYVEAIVKED